MIIVGYQGIGKSSLSRNRNGFIDLESGNFFVNGTRDQDWYIVYCNIAEHLSNQGYSVFVSSHSIVRDYLARNSYAEKIIVYPGLKMKDEWIEKLKVRWETSNKDKDYRAYMNAVEKYDENINDLKSAVGFDHVELKSMDYNLEYSIFYERNSDKI